MYLWQGRLGQPVEATWDGIDIPNMLSQRYQWQ